MEIEAVLERIGRRIEAMAKENQAALARVAASETRLDRLEDLMRKAEARADRADARMHRLEGHLVKIDKRLNATVKLVYTGMKMLANLQQAQKETDGRITALVDSVHDLVESQRQTDRKMQAFIDSLRKGSNGRRRMG